MKTSKNKRFSDIFKRYIKRNGIEWVKKPFLNFDMPSLMFLFALTFCETVYIYAIKTLYQRLNDHIKCTKWIVFFKKETSVKGSPNFCVFIGNVA